MFKNSLPDGIGEFVKIRLSYKAALQIPTDNGSWDSKSVQYLLSAFNSHSVDRTLRADLSLSDRTKRYFTCLSIERLHRGNIWNLKHFCESARRFKIDGNARKIFFTQRDNCINQLLGQKLHIVVTRDIGHRQIMNFCQAVFNSLIAFGVKKRQSCGHNTFRHRKQKLPLFKS